MKYLLLTAFLLFLVTYLAAQVETGTFELPVDNRTVTYEEGIKFYRELSERHREVTLFEMGQTDSGEPLHLVVYAAEGIQSPAEIGRSKKPVFLINNAIHAGEPDGVEASRYFLKHLAEGKILRKERQELVVAIIPFYSIGGVLNRNSTTRANQNGPEAYGFRGNARNYDLNRDFIKGDTRNAHAFWEIYHLTDPDFFLDTHVSNGSDYQYAITLISTQEQKLNRELQPLLREKIKPEIFKGMEATGELLTPYVNVHGDVPDKGFTEFPDWPRYSTGYTALFNTYGFMSETHMLKTFKRRVEATYKLMYNLARTLYNYRSDILQARENAKTAVTTQQNFPITWTPDREKYTELTFRGYENSMIQSSLTSQPRLYYNREKPFIKKIPYYNYFVASTTVARPAYYIIPRGWYQVTERLEENGIRLTPILSDTTITVTGYHFTGVRTASSVYEGHYPHYDISVETRHEPVQFRKGDFLVPVNQAGNRYIVETLEPQGEDSFFKWNFFDTILQRKEGFSSYVFEEVAEKLLEGNPGLNRQYRKKQEEDPEFAGSRRAQLNWLYGKSVHREKAYMRYPIFRIEQE